MKSRLVGEALIAALAWASSARADDAPASSASPSGAECAQSYERAQEQRKSGQLLAARDALRLCSREECPDFIQADCLAWHGEVQAELPTLVFSATSQGRDLTEVSVTAGDRVLAKRLEGQVVELDPGEYELVFAAPRMRSHPARVVVARGERNRLVRVELGPADADAQVPAHAPARLPPPRSLTAPALFVGGALVGISGFVALGAWGRASESQLESSCSPQCEREQVAAVRTKYLLADVSLGLGIASLAVAAYTFLRASPPATSAAGVGLHAGAGDVRMTYGGRF